MNIVFMMNGAIAALRSRKAQGSWGGPFNGQAFRQAIFEDLLKTFNFSLAIETGTYRGTTTNFLADGINKVITVEIDDYSYGYVKCRFLFDRRVKPYYGNSGIILYKVLKKYLRSGLNCFFYLDAHWQEYLPLKDEIYVIFERASTAVVMVDDFQVPDDAGYGFDDYGPGKTLNLDYLDDAIDRFRLCMFFPVCCANQESGPRRGCVILAREPTAEKLRHLATLREYWP